MKIALTIGGSDPTGGAGVQSDLKTFKSFGVYGLSILTSLTAQNTEGIVDIYDLPPGFFRVQLDTILRNVSPNASKTGMLYSAEIIKIVAEKIRQYSLKNLVIDPVIVSSTGVPLVKNNALELMKDYLFPLAKVVTPNIYEASLFTGVNIQDEEDMKKAATTLREFGPETVIITGGHFKDRATDLLLVGNDSYRDGAEFLSFQRQKFEGEYHGTGCVFSSAVTACLALDYDVKEATAKANDFVWKAIRSAFSIGKGMKVLDVL
jgi:hydroxymethylpyrimidine/phosphomethylpyrimidine kinase